MIAAMTGFLMMALAVPGIFGADGPAFALACLFVVVLHLAAFVVTGGRPAQRGVLELAPCQRRRRAAGELTLLGTLMILMLGAEHFVAARAPARA